MDPLGRRVSLATIRQIHRTARYVLPTLANRLSRTATDLSDSDYWVTRWLNDGGTAVLPKCLRRAALPPIGDIACC